MISCADILLEETPITSPTSGIVGIWFTCEFDPSDVDCRFFDDDGVQFTNDGSVYRISTFIASPGPGVDGRVLIPFDPQLIYIESLQVAIPTLIHL